MTSTTNPFETDVTKVPSTDLYTDRPLYGRYEPHPDDFVPDPERRQDDLEYWESVLERCSEENRISSIPGRRETFAVGSIIVGSSHLQYPKDYPTINYLARDRNEVKALSMMREEFANYKVPKIWFQGHIEGYPILIQERIAGVALNVAWQYLAQSEKRNFRAQARRLIHSMTARRSRPSPSFVDEDPVPIQARGLDIEEANILFKPWNEATPPGFVHNNLTKSNIIVRDKAVVGIIGWEVAGFFGGKRARLVQCHRWKEIQYSFATWRVNKKAWADMTYWEEDLYE